MFLNVGELVRQSTEEFRGQPFGRWFEGHEDTDLPFIEDLLGRGGNKDAKKHVVRRVETRTLRDWNPVLKTTGEVGEKVVRQFKVGPDGEVSVNIRRGENLLEVRFKSLEEMKEKSAPLYGHYEKLLGGD